MSGHQHHPHCGHVTAHGPPAIRLENLTLCYDGHPAVHHLSGRFAPGTLTAILGPNGAGKSTLLRALAGLRPVGSEAGDAGNILYEGCAAHALGYLPQRPEMDTRFPLTAAEFLAASAAARAHDRPVTLEGVESALRRVGLSGLGGRWLGALSAGQFQRLLFARLLLENPQALLLDEPFTALDAQTTEALMQILQEWRAEGRLVILVLHDPLQARRLCPQTLLLARDLVAWGKTEDVLTPEPVARAWNLAPGWDARAPLCAQDGTTV